MPTSLDPPLVVISVGKSRHSHDLVKSSGEYVINIPSEELLDEVNFCGSCSGRDLDKFEEAGLTPTNSEKVAPPRIEECVAHLECELVDEFPTGDHSLFLGKVVSAASDGKAFDKEARSYNADAFKPIYYLGGSDYVSLGDKIS